jgi:hypothetical protein
MGGDYYHRDVYSSDRVSSGFAHSDVSARLVGSQQANSSLMPKNRFLECHHRNGVVIDLDVTGSMGNWARTIYDKMPMFFGQIMEQGYLPDLSISFAANGDANGDNYPVQICEFGEGEDLDAELGKIYIEGNGGGNHHETYELIAWFYANRCDLPEDGEHYCFFLGDEGCYDTIKPSQVMSIFGETEVKKTATEEVFAALRQKFNGNVFLIHKNYYDDANSRANKEIVAQWEELLGSDHVLILQDPKAVVDIMLGAIAKTSGARSHDEYLDDMAERGQTQQRINEVSEAIKKVGSNTDQTDEGPNWL